MHLRIFFCTFASLFLLSSCNSGTPPAQDIAEEPDGVIQKTIIAFGDSLTAGYQLPPEESYPAQLEQRMHEAGYSDYRILNMGVSGDTTAGGLRRVDWALSQKPEVVILALGANDGLRGEDPETTRTNLEAIIQKFQAAHVTVLLVGMMVPRNLGPEYITAFEKIYPDLAKKYDLPFMPFLLQDVALEKDLTISDGMHPNAPGYQIVAENVWKYLEPLMKK